MPDIEVVQNGCFLLSHVLGDGTVPVCRQGPHREVLPLDKVQGPNQALLLHLPTVADRLALRIQRKTEQVISCISICNDYHS